MASLPTTQELLELRKHVALNSLEAGDDLIQVLADLRAQMREELSKPDCSADRVFNLFEDLWKCLAALPADHTWHSPPLFICPSLVSLLRHIVTMLLIRESRRVCGSTENTGHTVLGGAEGTGKTTLLRAVCIAATVLLERMVPVTFTFSAGSPVLPSELVDEASSAMQLPLGDAFHASTPLAHRALERLRQSNHDVLLILDEFQHVFLLPPRDGMASSADGSALGLRIAVAAQVETISRYGSSFGLIAGSSADMRTLMFRRGSRDKPDKWRAVGFPDFNGSLYQLYTVPALRSSADLSSFVQKRYPGWRLSDLDLAELLYYTGGIGRIIHSAFLLSSSTASVAVGIDHAREWLQHNAEASGSRRMRPSEAFDTLPLARGLLAAIVLRNAGAVDADTSVARHALPCIGMPRIALLGVLRTLSPKSVDAEGEVRELVDLSLLYEHEDGGESFVQLARPCDAHVYKACHVPTRRQLYLLTAVHLMVCGIDGDDAAVTDAHVTHTNAGGPLEELVRPTVSRLFPLKLSRTRFSVRSIAIVAGKLCLWEPTPAGSVAGAGVGAATPAGDGAWFPMTRAAALAVEGQMLAWQRETGLDGVLLVRENHDSASLERWLMHGWQCKGGHRVVQVTGGMMSTSIKICVNSAGKVKELDDTTSHGILVKAQVGMCQLLCAWHASMQAAAAPPQLVSASLTITTTKDARLARASIERGGETMRLDAAVARLRLSGLPASKAGNKWQQEWVKQALDAQIAVKLFDGTQWLRECLPTELLSGAEWIDSADLAASPAERQGAGTGSCEVM